MFLFSVLRLEKNIKMSTPRQQLAERIRNAAAKKLEAVAAIVAVRDAGQGPLFNDSQVKILEEIAVKRGMEPAEFLESCAAEMRPKLSAKASGEEMLDHIARCVKATQEDGRPKPSFSQESTAKPKLSFSNTPVAKPKPSSGHWYADQSPSTRWADQRGNLSK